MWSEPGFSLWGHFLQHHGGPHLKPIELQSHQTKNKEVDHIDRTEQKDSYLPLTFVKYCNP